MKLGVCKTIGVITVIAAIGLSSCQKEEEVMDFINSENESMVTTVENSVDEDVDAVSYRTSNVVPDANGCHACAMKDRLPDCAMVSESGSDYPKTIIIDYGSGCADQRGRIKRGKVLVNITNNMDVEGAKRTVTFDQFYVNDRKIEGSKVTTNIGVSETMNPLFTKQVNITMTNTDGKTCSRVAVGQKEWIAGYTTDQCEDDQFLITGIGTATRSDGKSRTRTVTAPIHIDRSCKYIISGVVEVTGGNKSASINFGDGACDNVAIVTKNGETREIDLDEFRHKWRHK